MEVGTELAEREVELGRQHQHRQARLEAEPPAHETHAHGDGDERHAQRRSELENRAGQESDPERLHRRAAMLLAHRLDVLTFGAAPVQQPQCGQAADDVQEVRREAAESDPALAGPRLGVTPDEPHEDGYERECHQHDERRGQVDRGDPPEHSEWDDARQHDLR